MKLISKLIILSLIQINFANAKICKSFFEEKFSIEKSLQKASKEHFKFYENIFTESIGPTVTMGAAWMTASQLVRTVSAKTGVDGFLNPAFLVTLPLDILLTLTSHYISLGHIPVAQKLLGGVKNQGKKAGYLSRVSANAILGASIIISAWYAAGIISPEAAVDINLKHSLGALALTTGVYAVLVGVKNYLFKTLPINRDKSFLEELKEKNNTDAGEIFFKIEEQAIKRAMGIGVDPIDAKNLSLRAVSSIVLSKPYELYLPVILKTKPRFKIVLKKISLTKQLLNDSKTPKKINSLGSRLKKQRQELVNLLLELYTKNPSENKIKVEIKNILHLGSPFNLNNSFELQKKLSSHAQKQKKKLILASLTDQFLSVGVAGGVFLYATTQWAQSGQLPWFIFW